MKRIVLFLGALTVLLGIAVTPAAARTLQSQHAQAGTFRVGLVLDVGGVNDKSFNHLAFLGMQQAEKKYGIKGFYVESHSPADYVPNLTQFVNQGYNLVIGVGFLMAGAMWQVASQHPNTKFALIDSAPSDPKGNTANLKNVANLFFAEQQSGYLVGVVAGLMEKNKVGAATHNTIGYMGGISIPPVNRYIAGYVAGARKVDPGIKILGGYSQSFTDQGKGKQIGLQQVSQGADILFQVAGSSGLGYLAAAQQRGKYGIGVDASQGYLGKYIITSALKKVNKAVTAIIHDGQSGSFRGGDHRYALNNGGTGYAKPSPAVPASIVNETKLYMAMIKQGKIVPPENIGG